MSPVPIYTPGWRETEWSKFPCIKETTQRTRLGPRTSRSAVRGVNHWPHTPPSLPDNNYTNRDPVSFAGPVNTRGLRSFAPKFELRKIRDNAGVREKWTWFQSQSHVKYTLFKSQGGCTYPYSPNGGFFPRGFLHWLGKIDHIKKFP